MKDNKQPEHCKNEQENRTMKIYEKNLYAQNDPLTNPPRMHFECFYRISREQPRT